VKLSIVVPCFNEQEVVPRLHEALLGEVVPSVPDLEVVFVDDGSTDCTSEVIKGLAARDERVEYVSLSRNFGKESAMLAGLRASRGDAVVIMDADLQHPPQLIPTMLEMLGTGVDQVIARRNRTGDPLVRTAMSKLYYRLMDRFVDVPLADGQGDFRLLSRRAVDALLSLPEANRFSKGLFGWIGFSRVTLDYENAPRAGGRSSWSLGRLFNYGLDGVISFNDKPLRASIWLGLAVVAVSVMYLVWLVVNAITMGIAVPGYITLVAVVTTLGGLQLVFLGIIGEYIGRIYYEAKQRPHYVVSTSSHQLPRDRGRPDGAGQSSQ